MTVALARLVKCSTRDCQSAATRFLPGSRRTFYCDKHGPTSIDAWNRLQPLGTLELPLDKPLPPVVETAMRNLADAIRHSLLPSPLELSPDMPGHIATLEAELAAAREQIRALEKLAEEALEAVPLFEGQPTPPPVEPAIQLVPNGTKHPVPPPPVHRRKDRERPAKLPRPEPKAPEAPTDRPLDPLMIPDPPEEALRTMDMVDLLNRYIPKGPSTPNVVASTKAIREWEGLSVQDRKRAMHALKRLACGPKYTGKMYPVRGQHKNESAFFLKAGERLRIMFEFVVMDFADGPDGAISIERFVDRASREFFDTE